MTSNQDSRRDRDRDLCPSWCVDYHDDGVNRHVSRTALIPGIGLVSRQPEGETGVNARPSMPSNALGMTGAATDLPGGEHAIGITLSVAIHSRVGSPLTWVYLGDGGPDGWEISTETAWLLIETMKELLDELEW